MRGRVPPILFQVARALPLMPLELMAHHLIATAIAGRPSIATRLADHAGTTFAIDPIDCPFAFLITLDGGRAHIRLVRDLAGSAYGTRIAAPLLVLLGLLDGTYDGDALFFSRDLVIEGDTEAALALRNAIENAELDPASVVGVHGAMRAPFNRVAGLLLGGLRRALDAPAPSGPGRARLPE